VTDFEPRSSLAIGAGKAGAEATKTVVAVRLKAPATDEAVRTVFGAIATHVDDTAAALALDEGARERLELQRFGSDASELSEAIENPARSRRRAAALQVYPVGQQQGRAGEVHSAGPRWDETRRIESSRALTAAAFTEATGLRCEGIIVRL
jgi:hypothetical protein